MTKPIVTEKEFQAAREMIELQRRPNWDPLRGGIVSHRGA
jgi:hypothetical protein